MVIYDKSGKEVNIPYAVDAKEWIATGDYFAEAPKKEAPKKEAPKKAEKVTEKK